ncbi:MAG: xanthine dehydrogenase family protein molybdopterin-binding subunit [Acidobacteria bacterium]|mgnify:CR=1 FL=1|nr:xanthine dehydrogenase family protein molybdopterin-binding subunit [Acidobacteriota bacterium]
MNRVELVTRRSFLGGMFSAGALVLGARLLPEDALAAAAASKAEKAVWNPSVYLGLEPDGSVIIVSHRSEMGTGIRSVLPMVLADELDADWKRVKVEQALGDAKYGSQNTDGSCSIRDFYDAMLQAGATARLMLERAAAEKWGVPASECKAKNHQVVHTSGKKLGYGELAALAAKQAVPKKEELKFKAPAEYRYIGKELPTIDVADICAGKGTFGIDAKMPGMVYASIERSPVYGGKLKSFDDKEARAVKGVLQTVVLPPLTPPYQFKPLGGVAVIANSTWAAVKGREKLKVEWDGGENAGYDSANYKQALLETVRQPQKAARNIGNVDAEFAKGGKIHEAEYYVPHLSHAPMEPPAAVADFKDGKVVIHTATQNPQAVQETVAGALGIDKKDVECHVTLLGGGFGRKSKPDYVAEAALLSKQVGKPVKVTWTREDDIRFDYYHAVAAMYLKARVDDKGRPTAWLQRSAFPSIGAMFNPATNTGQGFELGMGWSNLPFDIPNHRAENGPAKAHVRIGWLRSVANIYHAFGVHSFADELAALANRDRVEYLLDLLGQPRKVDLGQRGPMAEKFPLDIGRLRRVVELAAEKSGWANKKPSKGRALGIAAHWSFLSYIAAVVEVEVDDKGKLRIPRVDIAADVGKVISPDRVRSQFEGASAFGAGIALLSEITAKNGAIAQSNFHDYQVPRIQESPLATHVHLVNSNDPPAGVGEPGVPPMLPAICNAVYAATGKRIRDLPLRKHKLV